jgi:hypothetical protein
MGNDEKDIRIALAKAVAGHKIPDNAIEEVAKLIAVNKHPIRGINVCERGICIDYFIQPKDDWHKDISALSTVVGARFQGMEIFPWGIINPDILHVRVMHEFAALPQVQLRK